MAMWWPYFINIFSCTPIVLVWRKKHVAWRRVQPICTQTPLIGTMGAKKWSITGNRIFLRLKQTFRIIIQSSPYLFPENQMSGLCWEDCKKWQKIGRLLAKPGGLTSLSLLNAMETGISSGGMDQLARHRLDLYLLWQMYTQSSD